MDDTQSNCDFCVGPGMVCLLRRVPGIHQYMGEGGMAIMHYQGALVPLMPDIKFPQVHIQVESNAMSGFHLDGIQIRVIRMNVFETKCTGTMCDHQGLFRSGQASQKCGCAQMNSRLTVPCLAIDLELTQPGGDKIIVRDFASLHFINAFLFVGNIAPGTRANLFNDDELEELIDESLASITDEVNEHGGWTCTGWTKPGTVVDKAAGEAAGIAYNQQAAPIMVRAGTINYHLVRLVPTNPGGLNPVRMDEFRVDLNVFMNNGNVIP